MNGQLIWDNEEKTVLRQVYQGSPTVNDIQEMAAQTYDLLMAVPHKVHLIIESGLMNKAARDSFVQASRTLDQKVAPNQGMVVVVNETAGMQVFVKTVGVRAPRASTNVHTVRTLEEARTLIAEKTSKA